MPPRKPLHKYVVKALDAAAIAHEQYGKGDLAASIRDSIKTGKLCPHAKTTLRRHLEDLESARSGHEVQLAFVEAPDASSQNHAEKIREIRAKIKATKDNMDAVRAALGQ